MDVKYPLWVDGRKIMVGDNEASHAHVKRSEYDYTYKNSLLHPQDQRIWLPDTYTWEDVGKRDPKKEIVEANKYYCNLMGARINRRINQTYFKYNVATLPEQVWRFCKYGGYRWRLIDPYSVDSIHKNLEDVKQVVSDGTINLLPIMLSWDTFNTKQLKSNFGKSDWKFLANNSSSRNILISETVKANLWEEDRISLCKGLTYTELRAASRTPLPVVWALKNNKQTVNPKTREEYSVLNRVQDTYRMLSDLGKGFNPKWSLKRIGQEHDEASKEIFLRKNPNSYCYEPYEVTLDGYTFTLLETTLQVFEEGKEMHHCVGSYANSCSNGTYLVFKVNSSNERLTLGVSFDRNGKPSFNQMYGLQNSMASEEAHKAVDSLLKVLYKEPMKRKKGLVKC